MLTGPFCVAKKEFFRVACNGESQEGTSRVINLDHDPPGAVHAMLEYLYKEQYTNDRSESDTPLSQMQQLADIYAIGAKHDVPGLLIPSSSKFSLLVDQLWEAETFPGVTTSIYESTNDTFDTLRKAVVASAMKHIKILKNCSEFLSLLESRGLVGKDIVMALGSVYCQQECPGCLGRLWPMSEHDKAMNKEYDNGSDGDSN